MKKLFFLFFLIFTRNLYADVDYFETYMKFQLGSSLQQTKEIGQSSFISNTILAGVGIGYDLKPVYDIPLRTEILYGYRTNNAKKNYQSTTSTFNTKIDTLMLNVSYDFYKDSPFTPYITGGFGFSFPSLHLNSRQGDVLIEKFGYDGKKLAFNMGAGVSYEINQSFFSSAELTYTRVGNFTADYFTGIGDDTIHDTHHISYMNAFDFVLAVYYRF